MHFMALVMIPKNGDALHWANRRMAPYNEAELFPGNAVFESVVDDYLDEWDNGKMEVFRSPDGEIFYGDNKREALEKEKPEDPYPTKLREGFEKAIVSPETVFNSLDEYLEFLGFSTHDGKRGAWYNSRGCWDWWQVGGRWMGELDGYDPEKDPRNIKKCDLCDGTGLRNDALGKAHRKENPEYACNGCSGEGRCSVWPTGYAPYEGDVQLSAVVAERDIRTHALIDEYGEWESVAWDADSETADKWAKKVKAKLADHDGRVVVVDYHT